MPTDMDYKTINCREIHVYFSYNTSILEMIIMHTSIPLEEI